MIKSFFENIIFAIILVLAAIAVLIAGRKAVMSWVGGLIDDEQHSSEQRKDSGTS